MIARFISLVVAGALLGGCGSCNMLGGSQPANCDAGLAAGAVIAAPVLIPMAIANDAKARSVPAQPVEKWEPKTDREKEFYRAAGGQ